MQKYCSCWIWGQGVGVAVDYMDMSRNIEVAEYEDRVSGYDYMDMSKNIEVADYEDRVSG